MSFSLEHFFISVAISTQVASAPLIVSLFPFFLLLLSIHIDIYDFSNNNSKVKYRQALVNMV